VKAKAAEVVHHHVDNRRQRRATVPLITITATSIATTTTMTTSPHIQMGAQTRNVRPTLSVRHLTLNNPNNRPALALQKHKEHHLSFASSSPRISKMSHHHHLERYHPNHYHRLGVKVVESLAFDRLHDHLQDLLQ